MKWAGAKKNGLLNTNFNLLVGIEIQCYNSLCYKSFTLNQPVNWNYLSKQSDNRTVSTFNRTSRNWNTVYGGNGQEHTGLLIVPVGIEISSAGSGSTWGRLLIVPVGIEIGFAEREHLQNYAFNRTSRNWNFALTKPVPLIIVLLIVPVGIEILFW